MSHRRSEKNTESLIKQFFQYLTAEKGISEETASAHTHQIEFFATHYLRDYEGKSLLDASVSELGRKIFGVLVQEGQ